MNTLKDECSKEVKVIPYDLTARSLDSIKPALRNLTLVVNNAGTMNDGRFFEIDPKSLATESLLNMRAISTVTKAVLESNEKVNLI